MNIRKFQSTSSYSSVLNNKMYWMYYFFCLALTTISTAKKCDHLGVLLYEDLACTPVYNASESCPIKYKCDAWDEQKHDECLFRGTTYKIGEELPETGDPCSNDCTCHQYNNETFIHCPRLACDSVFILRDRPHCKLTRSFDECCTTGVLCPPFQTMCDFNGSKYHEGEIFYPPNSCDKCICQKGFNGTIEKPFCRRQTCGVELITNFLNKPQNYCAPVYGKDSGSSMFCCPDDFICSDGTETIKGTAKSDENCRFGTMTIKIGETVEKRNVTNSLYGYQTDKVQCECILPPLLTCKEV